MEGLTKVSSCTKKEIINYPRKGGPQSELIPQSAGLQHSAVDATSQRHTTVNTALLPRRPQ